MCMYVYIKQPEIFIYLFIYFANISQNLQVDFLYSEYLKSYLKKNFRHFGIAFTKSMHTYTYIQIS